MPELIEDPMGELAHEEFVIDDQNPQPGDIKVHHYISFLPNCRDKKKTT